MRTQEIVLKSIKKGNTTRKTILKDTKITFGMLHNALKRLHQHGLIKCDYHGNYEAVT